MTIHLPEDLERFIRSEILCGHFASEEEAVTEAVRRFRQANQPSMPASSNPIGEREFRQQLLEAGLMASRPSPADPAAVPDFVPIVIDGEPLSETIIRERR